MSRTRYNVNGCSCSVPSYYKLVVVDQQSAINAFASKRMMTFKEDKFAHGVSYSIDNIVSLAVSDGLVDVQDVSWVLPGYPPPSGKWGVLIAPFMSGMVDFSFGTSFLEKVARIISSPYRDDIAGSRTALAISMPAVAIAAALSASHGLPDDVDNIACVAAEWCDFDKVALLKEYDIPVIYDGTGKLGEMSMGYENKFSFLYEEESISCCYADMNWKEAVSSLSDKMAGLASINLYHMRRDHRCDAEYLPPLARKAMIAALGCGYLQTDVLLHESQYVLYDMIRRETDLDEATLACQAVDDATGKLSKLASIWDALLEPYGARLSCEIFKEAGDNAMEVAEKICVNAQDLGITQAIEAFFSGVPYDDLMV